jgi:RNA polymerase sigma factor (sigma-70 family)
VVGEKTDTELVVLARSGDKEAFGQLLTRYQLLAKRIAVDMVANEDIAQDLVQEAMLQAYLSLNHLQEDGRFKNWLYGIVLNVCRSYIRDQKAVFFSLEAMAGGMSFDAIQFTGVVPDPQQVAEEQELYGLVLAAINELSEKNRMTTLLFYQEQLSLQEVAAVLGISVVAVKGRLYKSRSQIKARLLPLYPEMNHAVSVKLRRDTMVKVTIADVLRQEHNGKQVYVIVLLDEAGHRLLPIWVGKWEGEAIAIGLRGSSLFRPNAFRLARPLTFNFIANLLEAVGAELVEVRIETIREGTFYAVAKLKSSDSVQEVDARPSDAIALALHLDSPVYVAQEVLERFKVDVPVEEIEKRQLGQGLENIMREMSEQRMRQEQERKATLPPTKEEIQSAYQKLIAVMFGSELD